MPIKPRGNGLEVSVQVTRNGQKYRHREIVHCTYEEAQAHEAQVRADLMAGRAASSLKASVGSKGIRLEDALWETFDRVWRGKGNEKNNKRNIEECIEFFGADTHIDRITTDDADGYIAHLEARDLAASTVRQKCCTMTRMFTHFKQRNKITSKPHFALPPVGENERDRVITAEEESALLRLFAEHYDDVLERRSHQGSDYVDLFAFLLDVGCRPSEARAIHTNWENEGRINLKKTKTGLSRTLPLTQRAKLALARQADRNGDTPFAWATPQVIRHAWDWARANMGLMEDDGFIPYALRHTCATRLYDRTRDLLIVKKWLGHKNVQTTLRYAKLQPHDLDRARDLLEAA